MSKGAQVRVIEHTSLLPYAASGRGPLPFLIL